MCGPEVALVEDVVDRVRAAVGGDCVSLTVGSVPEARVWAEADTYPAGPDERRLILVRDAHKLKGWPRLATWLDGVREIPNVYLLLVSAERDVNEWRGGRPVLTADGKRVVKAHLDDLARRSSATLVHCAPLRSEAPVDAYGRPTRRSDAELWVDQLVSGAGGRAGQDAVRHLWERAGGSVAPVRDVVRKAAVLARAAAPGPWDLTTALVDALCEVHPDASAVDALVRGDGAGALLALGAMGPDEYVGVVTQLERAVEQLGRIHACLRERKSGRELAEAAGVPLYVVRSWETVARNYDPARRRHCYGVLAAADDALRSGVREGVAECLVATWVRR